MLSVNIIHNRFFNRIIWGMGMMICYFSELRLLTERLLISAFVNTTCLFFLREGCTLRVVWEFSNGKYAFGGAGGLFFGGIYLNEIYAVRG